MQTSSLQQKPLTDGACDGSSPDSGSPHVPSLDPGPPSDKLLNATCRQKLGSCASRRNLPPTACLARLCRRGPSRARSGVLRDPPTARGGRSGARFGARQSLVWLEQYAGRRRALYLWRWAWHARAPGRPRPECPQRHAQAVQAREPAPPALSGDAAAAGPRTTL